VVLANAQPLQSAKLFPLAFDSHHHKSVVAPCLKLFGSSVAATVTDTPLQGFANGSLVARGALKVRFLTARGGGSATQIAYLVYRREIAS
jgi:hypothetical protein